MGDAPRKIWRFRLKLTWVTTTDLPTWCLFWAALTVRSVFSVYYFSRRQKEGLCPHKVRDLRGSRSKADARRAGPQGSPSGVVNRKLKVHVSGTPPVFFAGFLCCHSAHSEQPRRWSESLLAALWTMLASLMTARMLGKDLHPGRAQAVVGRATSFWDVCSGYSSHFPHSLHATPQSKYFSGPGTFEKPTPGCWRQLAKLSTAGQRRKRSWGAQAHTRLLALGFHYCPLFSKFSVRRGLGRSEFGDLFSLGIHK